MEKLIRRLIDYEPIAKADRFLTYADPLTCWWDPSAPDLTSISRNAFGVTRDQAEHLVSTSRQYVYAHEDEDEDEHEELLEPTPDSKSEIAANDDLYADERWDMVQAIELASANEKVSLFRSIGWDVLNHRGKPAAILQYIDIQLAMGALDLVGGVPDIQPHLVGSWSDALEKDASDFLRARRR